MNEYDIMSMFIQVVNYQSIHRSIGQVLSHTRVNARVITDDNFPGMKFPTPHNIRIFVARKTAPTKLTPDVVVMSTTQTTTTAIDYSIATLIERPTDGPVGRINVYHHAYSLPRSPMS